VRAPSEASSGRGTTRPESGDGAEGDPLVSRRGAARGHDVFDVAGDDDLDLDDDFDVPSFLR